MVGQLAGNKIPENMTSKATISGENYHRGHRGTQRRARVSNASEKAWDKRRIMQKRIQEGGKTEADAIELVARF
jgi:hypothetical protein